MSRSVLHACSCGRRYDADEWSRLNCAGVMDCGPGLNLELRDCISCGSTMAMVMQPVPVEVFEELRKDAAE